MTDKIIISCAITGSIHVPSQSPYLPVTADQIATQAIDAARAGATILHLHARDPSNGRPSADPDHWAGFLPAIKAGCDGVVNMTTGGSAVMTLDQRLAGPMRFQPEMCSLNMGTMNSALYPMIARIKEFKHDWERPFLENSDDLVFKNTPRDIAHVLRVMGAERGARFEFECYDVSHLYMLRHFVDRGAVAGPIYIQFVFGVLGGHGRRSGDAGAAEADRRPAVWRWLYVLGPCGRAGAGADGHDGDHHGRACARGVGG